MKTDIKARNFVLTNALHDHVNRRLNFALGRVADHVHKVTVRLSDINGPKGGIDKHCHIHVALRQLPDVVIEDIEADLYYAINRATDRASRGVARRLGRQRNFSTGEFRADEIDIMELGYALPTAERPTAVDRANV